MTTYLYVNDAVLLAVREGTIKDVTKKLWASAGMNMTWIGVNGKLKRILHRKRVSLGVKIKEVLEEVTELKYFRTVVCRNGSMESEIIDKLV